MTKPIETTLHDICTELWAIAQRDTNGIGIERVVEIMTNTLREELYKEFPEAFQLEEK